MFQSATDDASGERLRAFRAAIAALPQPEPVPDPGAMDRELERRLAFDPRCRENYERWRRSSRRSAVMDFLPLRIDIENVSRCNFRCDMCQVGTWPGRRRAADMGIDAFRRLIDEMYGLVEIKLHGMGEPTLGGDDFVAMTRYARERRIWVRTVTNASLLHRNEVGRKLVDADINEMQISLHAASEETFRAISGVSMFERVTENCRAINRYCEEQGVVRTKMWTVVQRTNLAELPQLVELAARTGFRTMVFSLDLTDFGQESLKAHNDGLTVGTDFDIDTAWRMVERGRELGVRVAFWAMAQMYDAGPARRLCPWPFERAYIGSENRISPCCMIGNPDVLEVGDGAFDSFPARWNDAAYAAFRQAHLDGRVPEICKGCYV